MLGKLCLNLTVLLSCLNFAGLSTAQAILWHNGEWDRDSADASERNTQVPDAWTVDDVVFDQEVTISGYRWFSLLDDVEPVGVDFIVLSDSFEKLVELQNLPFESELIGSGFGRPLYRMDIEALNVQLPPGHYYLGARPVGQGKGRAFTTTNRTILGESEAYFRSAFLGFPDWTALSSIKGSPKDIAFTVYGQVTLEQVLPDDFNIIFGQLLGGDVDSLHESDDDYVRIGNRPAVSAALPVIRMIVEGETVIDEASRIVVTVETAADSRPGTPLQRIAAFDYLAQQWITIDERPATMTDSIIEVILEDDPMRFVEPGTGRMKLRLDWFDPGPVINIAWGVRIDHVEWEVTR